MRRAFFVVVAATVLVVTTGTTAGAQAQSRDEAAPRRTDAAPTSRQLPTSSPFLGGVPSGTATAEPIALTVLEAIRRALEHNLGVLMSDDSIGRARGARMRAMSEWLPNVSGRLSESRQVLNLAAYGFPLPAGIPSIVGPFNLFDARLYVSQTVFDQRALKDLQVENHNISAATFTAKSARDTVVLVAANAYLVALAASARVDSARAQATTAEALYSQATNLKQNGLVAGIDVLRAEVALNTERQHVTATVNDFEKSKLQLARIIGLPLGQPFTLVSELPDVPIPDLTIEEALDRAYRARPDYQAALARVAAAQAQRDATAGEAMPSVRVNADYGELGLTPGSAHSTYAIVGALNVPIFQGGRTRGRVTEAEADLKSRRAEAEDLRASIYYDVRTAFMDLQSSNEQLQVATRGREVAATALTQARDRFAAGVSNNVEVIQAQAAVSIASEQYIGALYQYNVSKALLARGLGAAEDVVRQLLGGAR